MRRQSWHAPDATGSCWRAVGIAAHRLALAYPLPSLTCAECRVPQLSTARMSSPSAVHAVGGRRYRLDITRSQLETAIAATIHALDSSGDDLRSDVSTRNRETTCGLMSHMKMGPRWRH